MSSRLRASWSRKYAAMPMGESAIP
jgi:hypothetical protein